MRIAVVLVGRDAGSGPAYELRGTFLSVALCNNELISRVCDMVCEIMKEAEGKALLPKQEKKLHTTTWNMQQHQSSMSCTVKYCTVYSVLATGTAVCAEHGSSLMGSGIPPPSPTPRAAVRMRDDLYGSVIPSDSCAGHHPKPPSHRHPVIPPQPPIPP
eukprot:CAMPEP_0181218836 /NCGR_PEP_ID=MMETSP1096-20121128/27919_1 /TAXON_ID=156174 ORGANISM="Chrysochromulina ericina, Strain CCMP281" /NCGR_SAMPLE_ID=MMETSP1096 /ASSEMBLY_ACC=CAM_ASM_000453 /LENGTH=158 /DNA_ID=CAMNT_0023311105 /DNA_START=46 /DNA_END=520 /DNA_ORIENTATION=-